MKPRILQAGRLLPALEQRLAADYDLHRLSDEADPDAFLARHGGDFTGLVTSAGGAGAPTALIAALPQLRVIASFGVGLDKIDLAAARERGIAVGYTPDVLNDCVADTAFALLLDVARRTSEADRFVRAGRWAAGQAFGLGRKVSGARLGIVGLGRIGQTIARRAGGFDMDVRYHSRRPVAGVPWPHEPALRELARWADYLVIITAGGEETRHLIDTAVLDALGPRGFLINVARGSVIDEAALVRALVERRIAGAGLDVFEREPQVPAELLALDNVVLLPHIASGTEETRQAMAQRVLDNLAAFFAEGRLVSAAA
ncbi:hydroxyacid dehydrogenase [Acidovorax carolinensis]|uniref:Hydroxyacid dehydrogenase n=1 Tax=Acidovorax carolinensis TaxID=553814 RepID=A0A240UBR4_9BURK|nr:2-hydroxyacid dehydrogenase [Acidovorax carolinensis]ART55617.1 hydroxyacid dehydrogenase [Acidovorax carolinensis]ART58525.1 hydroxyacid dehydrogenase [Acidovorax carolinensis]